MNSFTNMDADFGHVTIDDDNTPSTPSCGQPGQAVLNGLPAIGCGADFDKNLDAQLGYYSSENTDLQVSAIRLYIVLSPTNATTVRIGRRLSQCCL